MAERYTHSEAVAIHEDAGGRLSRESTFGRYPLECYPHPHLQHLRDRDFHALYPLMQCIFYVLHNHGVLLREAILTFISLCEQFSSLIQA